MMRTTTGNEKVKCKSITRSQPVEIIGPPKSVEIGPPGKLQKSSSEYPNAAVGTMNGMSAKVSRTLSHLDLPRVISQASGIPASRSKAATTSPTMNEFLMAVHAVFIKAGWLMTFWTVGNLINIPRMGGIRINAKKIATAET